MCIVRIVRDCLFVCPHNNVNEHIILQLVLGFLRHALSFLNSIKSSDWYINISIQLLGSNRHYIPMFYFKIFYAFLKHEITSYGEHLFRKIDPYGTINIKQRVMLQIV